MRIDTRTPVAESQWLQLSLSCFQSLSQYGIYFDERTVLASKGQFPTCDYTDAKSSGPSDKMTAAEIAATPWDGWISCIYTMDSKTGMPKAPGSVGPSCKHLACMSPGACARHGGQNLGNHHD